MSGRVRWRRDGEVVTGFRKTDRRNAPARPIKDRLTELAEKGGDPDPSTRVRLAFLLPATLQALLTQGDHGPGIEVLGKGFVRISSWCADKCFEKAQAFFRDVAKDKHAFTITAVIISTERLGERYCRHLTIVRGAMVVSIGSLIEPKVFEAA